MMKVTYNWLREFVEIEISPQELAEKLTLVGLEVTSLERFEDDWVLEVEVTTNRPDWLSVVGIAREISAITGKRFKFLSPERRIPKPRNSLLPFKIKIDDKKGCLRYVGRIIENVEVKPSPPWLQKKLLAVGLRPINNIVDITNYCLLESGQPLHAFDYEKIEGGIIIVRKARRGESIVTIDDKKHELDETVLVIADEKKPIAIAGIMGGRNTEVTESTKTVLLESAYFHPIIIRHASQKLGLVTESSYRFEREVDLDTVLNASLRATDLIEEFASSPKKVMVSKLKDRGLKKRGEKEILLSLKRVNKFLGREISSQEIEKILKRLGFFIKKKKEFLKVKPPRFRQDIEIEEDLIEEIARIYGYDKFPLTLPAPMKEVISEAPLDKIRGIIYETLLSLGFNEVITYSLVGEDILRKVNLSDKKEWVRLNNPLSKGQEFLRPTLVASILEVVCQNLKHQVENIKIFEWGKIYLNREGFPEIPHLGICHTGSSFLGWLKKEEKMGFYDLKGIIELILSQIGIKKVNFLRKDCPYLERGYSAEIEVEKEAIGFLGKIKGEVQKNFDLPPEIYWAEINLNKLVLFSSFEKKFAGLSKFPFVLRDISFVVEEKIPYEELEKFFKDFPTDLLKEITLIDVYQGENIPSGKKSLTFSLKFQSDQRTLCAEEIEALMDRIRQLLKEKFKVELR
ncbi:MAG: phenylalanine--tRNA ligase subunit beta [Candidatus Omnitrophica bacterium]|nr:phenylalanine--tRNA ligase subunit beta [Candidatus Omnitrophota bacterium]